MSRNYVTELRPQEMSILYLNDSKNGLELSSKYNRNNTHSNMSFYRNQKGNGADQFKISMISIK